MSEYLYSSKIKKPMEKPNFETTGFFKIYFDFKGKT